MTDSRADGATPWRAMTLQTEVTHERPAWSISSCVSGESVGILKKLHFLSAESAASCVFKNSATFDCATTAGNLAQVLPWEQVSVLVAGIWGLPWCPF